MRGNIFMSSTDKESLIFFLKGNMCIVIIIEVGEHRYMRL